MSYAIATSGAATKAVIEPLISTAWTALGYSADTVEWPNKFFTKPGNGPWIRVSYPDQSTSSFSWGGGTVLNGTIGILAIQVFAPKGAGSALLNAAADKFRATFERKAFGTGIRFRDALGPSKIDDEKWAGVSLQLPYEFHEAITL